MPEQLYSPEIKLDPELGVEYHFVAINLTISL